MSNVVEVYRDSVGEWRWRITSSVNGQTVAASGESFASKWSARRAVRAFVRGMQQ